MNSWYITACLQRTGLIGNTVPTKKCGTHDKGKTDRIPTCDNISTVEGHTKVITIIKKKIRLQLFSANR